MDVGPTRNRLANARHAHARCPPIRALLLSLLLLSALAALPAPALAGNKYTNLYQFAGGLNQTSAYFGSCQSSDNGTSVKLPYDGNVTAASLTIYTDANGTNSTHFVAADVGEDGSEEANVTFSGSSYREMALGGSGFNNYTAAKNQTSGNITVPIKFNTCAPTGGWNITFYNLSLTYLRVIAANTSSPAFSGSIPDIQLKVNTTSLYAVYLPGYFSDADNDSLNYAVVKSNASDPGWSNVTASVNGSYLGLASSNNWTGNLTFKLNATDPANLSAESNLVNLEVFLNRAPRFASNASIPNQQVTVNLTRSSYTSFPSYFYDPDFNDTLAYSVTKANASDPGWANVSINVSLGYFVFNSSNGWLGNLSFRMRATDAAGAWAESNSITLTVRANEAPVFSGSIPNIVVGFNETAYGNTTGFSEPDSEPMTINFVKSNPNATGWAYVNVSGLNGSSNLTLYPLFFVTASGNWSGTLSGWLRATDPGGLSTDSNTFDITVNGRPVFSANITDQTIKRGTTEYAVVNLSLYFSDPENDALTYSAYRVWSGNNTSTPITVTVNGSFLDIASLNAVWTGSDVFYVYACDGYGRCAYSNDFTVFVVVQPNRAPVFNGTLPDINLIEGRSNLSAIDLAPYYSDADNDALTFGISKADTNATGWQYTTISLNGTKVDVRSTSVTWTGDLVVAFWARDPSNKYAWSNNMTVRVLQRDLVPTFTGTIANLTLASGGSLGDAFDADDYFSDPNGLALSYGFANLSSSEGWNYTTLSWNGSRLNVSNDGSAPWTGSLTFRVKATDANGTSVYSNEITVTITSPPANAPPAPSQPLNTLTVAAGGTSVVVVDLAQYFTDDRWPELLTFDVVKGNESAWSDVDLNVSGTTLTVTFLAPVPPVNLTFEVKVTDAWGETYLSPPVELQITPNPVNHAPQVAGPSAATLQLGAPLQVQMQAFDDDGDALTWETVASASGLSAAVSPSTKMLTLYGAGLDERAAFAVLVRVRDGWGAEAEWRITVNVWDPARAPALSLALAANRSGALWVNGTAALGVQPANQPPLSVALSVDGGPELFAALGAGAFGFLWPDALAVGEHIVVATLTDGYGRAGRAQASAFVPEPLPKVPTLLGILRDGLPPGEFNLGEPLTFVLQTSAPVPSGVTVEWYLDGSRIGEGTTIAGLTPPPGLHTIEARASNGEVTRSVSAAFSVKAPVAPTTAAGGGGNPALLVGFFALAVAALGLLSGLTQTGRYFIAWAILGSVFARLKRESLLDHFVRGRLYQAISDSPGIHLAELRRRTRVAHGTAIHHLHVLEKGGYIRAVPSGSLTRFYPTDQPFEEESYGLTDSDRAVLSVVAEAPGISQGELSVRLQRSPSTVSRSVARLSTLGYVTSEQNERGVGVYPRPGARLDASTGSPEWSEDAGKQG